MGATRGLFGVRLSGGVETSCRVAVHVCAGKSTVLEFGSPDTPCMYLGGVLFRSAASNKKTMIYSRAGAVFEVESAGRDLITIILNPAAGTIRFEYEGKDLGIQIDSEPGKPI